MLFLPFVDVILFGAGVDTFYAVGDTYAHAVITPFTCLTPNRLLTDDEQQLLEQTYQQTEKP